MCLLIHKPAAATVSMELIKDAYKRNHDGIGIMLAYQGDIEVYKFLDLTDFYHHMETLTDMELFIHFRMRTHGNISLDNVHPFQISDDLWLMHNGVISDVGTCKLRSDTKLFVELITPMLQNNPNLLFDLAWQKLIAKFCHGSRLAFLHSSGRSVIINEQDGINWRGLWLSNTYAWSLWDDRSKLPLKMPDIKTKAFTSSKTSDKYSLAEYEWDLGRSDQWDYLGDDAEFGTSHEWEDDFTLMELRGLSQEELEGLMYEDPDMVIRAIKRG